MRIGKLQRADSILLNESFLSTVAEGENYSKLSPVVGVLFVRFPIYRKFPERRYDRFAFCSELYPGNRYSDLIKIRVVNIPKTDDFPPGAYGTTELENWIKLLNYPRTTSEDEMTSIAERERLIAEAKQIVEKYPFGSEVWDYVDELEMIELDRIWRERERQRREERLRAEAIAEGRACGLEQGQAEGRAEGQAEGQIEMLRGILTKRFGADAASIAARVAGRPASELQDLAIDAATCASLDDFRARL